MTKSSLFLRVITTLTLMDICLLLLRTGNYSALGVALITLVTIVNLIYVPISYGVTKRSQKGMEYQLPAVGKA